MTEETKQPISRDVTKPPVSSPKSSTKTVDKTTIAEIGGPSGPEPTRYGDWEVGGRCSDF